MNERGGVALLLGIPERNPKAARPLQQVRFAPEVFEALNDGFHHLALQPTMSRSGCRDAHPRVVNCYTFGQSSTK